LQSHAYEGLLMDIILGHLVPMSVLRERVLDEQTDLAGDFGCPRPARPSAVTCLDPLAGLLPQNRRQAKNRCRPARAHAALSEACSIENQRCPSQAVLRR
jgi:hypothetical protein